MQSVRPQGAERHRPPALDYAQFQAQVSESFVPLRISAPRAQRFRASLRAASAAEVHVVEIQAGPHTVDRAAALIRPEEPSWVKLSMPLGGTARLVQDGREAHLAAGDVAVYDTRRPYALEFDDDFRSLVLMFPSSLVGLPARVLGSLTAVVLSGHHGPGAVVTPFLAGLVRQLDGVAPSTAARLAHNAVDLVTTMLAHEAAALDAQPAPAGRALTQRIRAYIETHLAGDLRPARIAAEHYISTRHLHGLFQAEGTTVAGWIRERRLEHCRRELLDPALTDRPVAAIASRWGFSDPAHFSRIFKASYGCSPRDLRPT